MTTRFVLWVGIISLLVGAIGALGIEASCRKRVVSHQEAVANQHQAVADTHQAQAVVADAKVDTLAVPLASARAQVVTSRGEVARLERALEDEKAKPGPTDLSGIVSTQNNLIVGLRDENDRLNVLIGAQDQVAEALTASRDEWRLTAQERQKEAQALRIALNASKALNKPWAAGATWERTQNGREGYGAFVDRDLWSTVRAGVEVFQTRLPATHSDLGIKIKLGLRF